MPAEGMVHALRRARDRLAPGGCLIDLRPTSETARIEAGGEPLGRLAADAADRGHAAAEAALATALAEGVSRRRRTRILVPHARRVDRRAARPRARVLEGLACRRRGRRPRERRPARQSRRGAVYRRELRITRLLPR
jgi:hypothetical protein